MPHAMLNGYMLRCGTAHDGARFGRTYDGSHSHWPARKCKKEGRLVEVGQGTGRNRFSQRSLHNEASFFIFHTSASSHGGGQRFLGILAQMRHEWTSMGMNGHLRCLVSDEIFFILLALQASPAGLKLANGSQVAALARV